LQARLGLLQRDSRLQPRHDGKVHALICCVGIDAERNIYVYVLPSQETTQGGASARDSNHSLCFPVQRNGLAKNPGIAREALHPNIAADHNDAIAVGEVLFWGKRAALENWYSEAAKRVRRRLQRTPLLGCLAACVVEKHGTKGGDILEHAGLRAPMDEPRGRGVPVFRVLACGRIAGQQHHEPVRIGNAERL
jgi:hypothetical protein